MQQNFTIVLKKQGINPAPEQNTNPSIPVPNTGNHTNLNTTLGNLAGGTSIILAITLGICLLAYHAKKNNILKNNNITKALAKIFTVAFLTTFTIASILSFNAFANNTNTNNNTNSTNNTTNSISISISDLSLNLEIDKGDTFGYAMSEVKVNESTNYGYTLSAYTTTPDLVNTKDSTQKISALTTNTTTTNTTTKTVLGANTWGIALNQPTNPNINENSAIWQSLSSDQTNATIIKDTDSSTPAKDTTSLYLGVNANDKLALGEYKGTINYTIVAKPAPEPPCPAGNICYRDNGANSPTTMSNQTVSSTDTEINLWPSNFQYQDPNLPANITIKGFAGWNTKADGTGASYGPNETITDATIINEIKNNGLRLYANWIDSAGSLQNWNGCNTMNIGDITALTDERDNNTYAVAKLADNKCWMIENLRLDNTAELTSSNTNNPSLPLTNTWYTDSSTQTTKTTSNYLSPTSSTWCTEYSNADCVDQSMLNTNNTKTPVSNMTAYDNNTNTYSLGNYYNWYSATAGHGTDSKSSGSTAGDICPAGWHLPTGSTSGEYKALNDALSGDIGSTGSNKLRSYLQNFIYSGGSPGSRSSIGYYWSSTAYSRSYGYRLVFVSSSVYPGTDYNNKSNGYSVRCISSS